MASSERRGGSLVALLHLCDSLFPTGGFAQSDGLEAATASGQIEGAGGLREWMTTCLTQTVARAEGPAVQMAWQSFVARDWTALEALDAEMHAMRPSSSMRKASRSMGSRLVRTWLRVRPGSPVQVLPPGCRVLTLPVAFGVVCAASNIELVQALEGFAYTRLAAAASAAMRLMAIGQHEAHGILADLLGDTSDVVERIIGRDDRPMAFVPALDVAAMRQQYVHSRLFRS